MTANGRVGATAAVYTAAILGAQQYTQQVACIPDGASQLS